MDVPTYVADINFDDSVNIADMIRMKKYFLGEVIHLNETEEGLSWIILDGVDGMGIISGVGFTVTTTCYTKTVISPDRYITNVSAFIKTDRNPNPELDQPILNVASVVINDEQVVMSDSESSWADPNWIWDFKVSNSKMYASQKSTYNCLFTAMLDGTVVPYRDVENSFNF